MKEYKQLIEHTKFEIMELQNEQNRLYDTLVDKIKPEPLLEGWLWDYCFNCSGDTDLIGDDYAKMVRGYIYGCEE